jgi:hypothetical protein
MALVFHRRLAMRRDGSHDAARYGDVPTNGPGGRP